MSELTKTDKERVLDLVIKIQSALLTGHVYSAGQFIEEVRHILEYKTEQGLY